MLARVLLVLFLWGNATAYTSKDCPHTIAHDKYTQVFGNRCFRFWFDVDLEFKRAQEFCKQRGGNLAMMKTKAVNDFITHHLQKTYKFSGKMWIGLNDIDVENSFQWVDGTSLGSYSNWANENEGPRSGIKHLFRHNYEDCVAIDAGSRGKWRDYRCKDFFLHVVNEHKHFICEFSIIPPAPTTQYSPTSASTHKTTTKNALPTGNMRSHTPTAPTSTPQSSKPTVHRETATTSFPTSRTSQSTNIPSSHATTKQYHSPTTKSPPRSTKVIVTTLTSTKSSVLTTNTDKTTGLPQIKSSSQTSQGTTCPNLVCNLDCGMAGYALNAKGCLTCKCELF